MPPSHLLIRNRIIHRILWAVAIALLLSSVYSVYSAWRSGLIQSRTETASRLMAIRTSPLSTETPGLNAWVSWSLLNFQSKSDPSESQKLRRLVHPKNHGPVPPLFDKLHQCLKEDDKSKNKTNEKPKEITVQYPENQPYLEFRSVGKFTYDDETYVFSHRKEDTNFQELAVQMASHLHEIKERWGKNSEISTGGSTTIQSFRVARFYLLDRDGRLVSFPISSSQGRLDPKQVVESEQEEFLKNPVVPGLVSDHFFFRFRYDQPLEQQVAYSGTYLDLGGIGLVATVSRPVILEGRRCVLGADIAFDVSWQKFANELSPSILSHVAHIEDFRPGEAIWERILESIPKEQTLLRNSVSDVAESQSGSLQFSARKSAYIASVPGGGDAMAVQVDRTTWLLLLLNTKEPSWPWMTMLLTAVAFGCLLIHMEWSKRAADRSRQVAHDELQEKQNLLDTMQVPLMVVDPNTDQLVFCNQAAQNIGMTTGQLFGRDIVAGDKKAEELYRKNQVAVPQPRRAYGVPIRLPNGSGYAIVRSVAVTAPIASLSADSRHRLGILFVLEEENDLAILLHDRLTESRNQERQKLSGLMSHGLELFTRVLAKRLSINSQEEEHQHILCWMADHINSRLRLICWTLDNWDSEKAILDSQETLVSGAVIEEYLQNLQSVFQIAAEDRTLREQLHWNNGPIGQPQHLSSAESNTFSYQVEWPEEYFVAEKYEGVLAFVLCEILINAARHGAGESKIHLEIQLEPVRRELLFEVKNGFPGSQPDVGKNRKAYGGIEIVKQLASLCDWAEPEFIESKNQFLARLQIPAIPKAK